MDGPHQVDAWRSSNVQTVASSGSPRNMSQRAGTTRTCRPRECRSWSRWVLTPWLD